MRATRAQWSAGAAGPVLAAVPDLEDHAPASPSPLAWQDEALCGEVGGDFWFPEKGESTREAKQVCVACPVRAICLQYALDGNERFGIWGGLSERERRRLARDAA